MIKHKLKTTVDIFQKQSNKEQINSMNENGTLIEDRKSESIKYA